MVLLVATMYRQTFGSNDEIKLKQEQLDSPLGLFKLTLNTEGSKGVALVVDTAGIMEDFFTFANLNYFYIIIWS